MVYPILPQNLNSSEEKNFTFISNAYRFYSDSISQENGWIERKIASAVIGFESLFLKTINEKPKEKLLRRRLTKLFENENFDQKMVKMQLVKHIFAEQPICTANLLYQG